MSQETNQPEPPETSPGDVVRWKWRGHDIQDWLLVTAPYAVGLAYVGYVNPTTILEWLPPVIAAVVIFGYRDRRDEYLAAKATRQTLDPRNGEN